jgi:hypothetical protein
MLRFLILISVTLTFSSSTNKANGEIFHEFFVAIGDVFVALQFRPALPPEPGSRSAVASPRLRLNYEPLRQSR